jgi:hypothetical protein
VNFYLQKCRNKQQVKSIFFFKRRITRWHCEAGEEPRKILNFIDDSGVNWKIGAKQKIMKYVRISDKKIYLKKYLIPQLEYMQDRLRLVDNFLFLHARCYKTLAKISDEKDLPRTGHKLSGIFAAKGSKKRRKWFKLQL